jgi:hypothetical protein
VAMFAAPSSTTCVNFVARRPRSRRSADRRASVVHSALARVMS